MKRIILSFVTIIASIAMVAGSTSAVFSASSNITNNVTTAGTLTFVAHNFTGNKPIGTTATSLVPGMWTPEGRAELYNTGTVPARVYMSITGVTGLACDKINLQVFTGYAGGNEHIRTVYDYALNWLSTNRVEVTGNPPFATLLPNWSQVIWQKAGLDSSADNSYQGKDCHWTEVFTAESITP